MRLIRTYIPAISIALFMCFILYAIYPHYQYYVDPDGTAYLTISQRYANADYLNAINGYWSPWACWLTAVVIKMGIAAIPASIFINTLGAICFVIISQSFFLKFNVTAKLQWLLCGTLCLFLCYAVFWQSFDDLWESFFLLSTLRIILADNFTGRPALWVSCGLVGTLAYFAKAYAIPFYILNTTVCTYLICRHNKIQWLKISTISISILILCSMPWIILLHNKYGIWTTSTAGPLNMSWYLVGHPYWRAGINLLIPPPYNQSIYYWEDPYVANGITPHFWDSWHLFGLQLLRAGYNLFKLLRSIVQLSILFPAIAFIALLSLRSKLCPLNQKVLITSCLLFPLGYVLINFESRYLWYIVPPAMVVAGIFLENLKPARWRVALYILFSLTFLFYPAYCMIEMYDEGLREYKIAAQLYKENIRGSFTAIASTGIEAQRMARLAYFSGNPLYNIPSQNIISERLVQDMKRCHVHYFYSFRLADKDNNAALQENFIEVAKGRITGIRIFIVKP